MNKFYIYLLFSLAISSVFTSCYENAGAGMKVKPSALGRMNEIVEMNGVRIIGTTIAPESVSTNASELFGKNLFNFLDHLI